jgi:hypothetical protein
MKSLFGNGAKCLTFEKLLDVLSVVLDSVLCWLVQSKRCVFVVGGIGCLGCSVLCYFSCFGEVEKKKVFD